MIQQYQKVHDFVNALVNEFAANAYGEVINFVFLYKIHSTTSKRIIFTKKYDTIVL